MSYLDVNSVKTDFSILSSPFHIHSILKLAPVPSQKSEKNAFGAHFLQLYRKNEYGDPHFLFHDFNKDSTSFRWEKNWHKSMFSFLAILLNCTDWPITGRIARVQFNFTLERKVKTVALKGIFLVSKWINNTINSNSVRYHMHHRKNLSFMSSFGLRAVFVKVSKIALFVSIVTSKRARWPPLFTAFLSSSWLVTSVYQVSSTIYVRFFYYGITLTHSCCRDITIPEWPDLLLLLLLTSILHWMQTTKYSYKRRHHPRSPATIS